MKRVFLILIASLLVVGCQKEDINNSYSDVRTSPYLYYVDKCGYATFERYMWDEGFPDTIIVKFTRDGKFERYVEAVRGGSLYNSDGVPYSPAYVFYSGVGDSWTYDIKGKFIEFGLDTIDNPGRETFPYNP